MSKTLISLYGFLLLLLQGFVHLSAKSINSTYSRGYEEYQELALLYHNYYRSSHHVEALDLDRTLNSVALKCADYYIQRGLIDSTCPHARGFGENLYETLTMTLNENFAAADSSAMWYSEEPRHDYKRDYQGETGRFSQMVWKSTYYMGFGVAHSENGNTVAVAVYYPQGNIRGEFYKNVFKP